MNAVEIVPGFDTRLHSSAVASRTHAELSRQLEGSWLTRRNRAQIALAAAERSGCAYAVWAQTCLARAEGLSAEDICLARIFTALDPREAAILHFAYFVMRRGEAADALGYRFRLSNDETHAIITAVTLSTLVNLVVASLAPAGGRSANVGQRASRRP